MNCKMEKVLKQIATRSNAVSRMYTSMSLKVSLPTVIKRKQQEIRHIEELIERNAKVYEFLDDDERQITQINTEMTVADAIISQLEKDIEHLLQTPFSERDTKEFALKSNQLHDLIQQQDMLRNNRQMFIKNYEANNHSYNVERQNLYKRLEELQNELFVLQQKR